jgi:hypothetical protein
VTARSKSSAALGAAGGAGVVLAVVMTALAFRAAGGGVGLDPATRSAPAARPGAASSSGRGARSDLVASGFSPDASGAAEAATSYLSTLERLVHTGPVDRATALRRLSASDAGTVVQNALDGLATLDALTTEARRTQPDARLVLREAPVAYDVSTTGAARARVRLWTVAVVLIEGRTEPREVWSTNTVDLVWEDGDWRVADWARRLGPVPTAQADPTPSAAGLDALHWSDFRHVPQP